MSSITTENLTVSQFAYFINDVVFNGNVRFKQAPTFSSDTAGFAIVSKGQDSIDVNFDNEYINTPIVTVSIAMDNINNPTLQKQIEDSILSGNISFIVSNKSTKGFTIRLNKAAPSDLQFSWVALSVQNAKTSNSNLSQSQISTQSAAFQSVLNQLSGK